MNKLQQEFKNKTSKIINGSKLLQKIRKMKQREPNVICTRIQIIFEKSMTFNSFSNMQNDFFIQNKIQLK